MIKVIEYAYVLKNHNAEDVESVLRSVILSISALRLRMFIVINANIPRRFGVVR
jgi:hypothetical protein